MVVGLAEMLWAAHGESNCCMGRQGPAVPVVPSDPGERPEPEERSVNSSTKVDDWEEMGISKGVTSSPHRLPE